MSNSYRFEFKHPPDKYGGGVTIAFVQANNLAQAINEVTMPGHPDLKWLYSVSRMDAELAGNPVNRLPSYIWGAL